MFIGYLPHGAEDTFLEKLQLAGCHKIVRGSKSGDNSELSELTTSLHEGDVLILCRSSHGGSETDFLHLLIQIGSRHAHFVSIEDNFDTLRDTALHYAEATH